MGSKSTLTLFRGSLPTNAYVWSPFVTKLEARLRFASKPYVLDVGGPRSAPKGKIPYIQFPPEDGGESLGDSTFIIRHLASDDVITDLNAALMPVQRAQDLAIRALMEDKVYFYNGKEKWCDNYTTMRDGVLGLIPWPVRLLVGYLARRKNINMLYGQGTLRFSDEEIATLKEEVWESVDALLVEARKSKAGSKEPFWVLGGEEPTEVDATMYGFVVGGLVCDA